MKSSRGSRAPFIAGARGGRAEHRRARPYTALSAAAVTEAHGKATRRVKTSSRGSRRREALGDERRKRTEARKTTSSRARTARSLARLAGEENEGGQRSRGKTTTRGGYWTLMARPEAVGAAMPTTTVARPPFWLVTRVVTTGMARSGVLTDVNSCLPRSPSSVECYHGERSGRDKWR